MSDSFGSFSNFTASGQLKMQVNYKTASKQFRIYILWIVILHISVYFGLFIIYCDCMLRKKKTTKKHFRFQNNSYKCYRLSCYILLPSKSIDFSILHYKKYAVIFHRIKAYLILLGSILLYIYYVKYIWII